MCNDVHFYEIFVTKNTNNISIFSMFLEFKVAALNIIKDRFSDCYCVSCMESSICSSLDGINIILKTNDLR